MQKNSNVLKLARGGMLAAIAIILVFTIRFAPIAQVPFLEYTPAGVPIFSAALMFGTLEGLMIALVVSIVQGITVSAHSGIYGIIMQILSLGSFVLAAGLLHKIKRINFGAPTALAAGTAFSALVMIGANLVVTPLFTGMSATMIWTTFMPFIVAFNLFSAIINSAITFVIFKLFHNKLKRTF